MDIVTIYKNLNSISCKEKYLFTGGIHMGLFGGKGGFFGDNSEILFFIILFLLLFNGGFGFGGGYKDC